MSSTAAPPPPSLPTTSAQVSITAFTWRLRPNELLRALPDKLWLQWFPMTLPSQLPALGVTSQSRPSRKERGVAPASPVHSPAPYSQATFTSSFSQGAGFCTDRVLCHQVWDSPALKSTARFVRDKYQKYAANQTQVVIKHIKGRLPESVSPDKPLQPG